MKQHPVQSSIALLLVIVIVVAIIGWVSVSQQGIVTETVEVGGAGIKKAQEVKLQLEESSQSQSSI